MLTKSDLLQTAPRQALQCPSRSMKLIDFFLSQSKHISALRAYFPYFSPPLLL
jgi:hypothetical protein